MINIYNIANGNETKIIADGFFYNNQYDKAINYYRKILESKNDNPEIYYRIGLSYFLIKDFKNSSLYWTKAKELNPGIFKGRIFQTSAKSMNPTLIEGDHVIIDRDFYKHKKMLRGDVVVYLSPEDPNKSLIHRVVGLPGDTIVIKKKELFINNKKFAEKSAMFADPKIFSGKTSPRDNLGPIEIPQEKYFLLGDNRDFSYDSRFFGFVDKDYIVGKALMIYYSSPERYSLENSKPERTGLLIE